MTKRENILRAIRFETPDYIPMGFVPPYLLNAHADKPSTDPWGCVWMTAEDGITGAVHGHPLDTWEKFRGYNAPDPVDWNELSERVTAVKERGEFVRGGIPHGHTFLRLQDIRGISRKCLCSDGCHGEVLLFSNE